MNVINVLENITNDKNIYDIEIIIHPHYIFLFFCESFLLYLPFRIKTYIL